MSALTLMAADDIFNSRLAASACSSASSSSSSSARRRNYNESNGEESKGDETIALEFPLMLGPFTMRQANLVDGFNAFGKLQPFVPKPDLAGNENVMLGFDYRTATGLPEGDFVFCQLSPMHPITPNTRDMVCGSNASGATYFAWAYSLVLEPHMKRPKSGADAAFVDNGGFVYFNSSGDVVGINCITRDPLGCLTFGRPQPLPGDIVQILTRQGRFQEVTQPSFRAKGATHFVWIRPSEFAEIVANSNGCFGYKFENRQAKYFPVVSRSTFENLRHERRDEVPNKRLKLQNTPYVILPDAESSKAVCPICMDDNQQDMIKLRCSHEFHRECVQGQLNTRWTDLPLSNHLALREKVIQLCLKRAQENGLSICEDEKLVMQTIDSTLSAWVPVMQTMAAYQCKACDEPFCGGRVDCFEEEAINVDTLVCPPCSWKAPSERKCTEHGVNFAMYKCDSCCAIATWDCSGNHFCDRCHQIPSIVKNFPCPGPGKCPLGIPHPPNTAGVYMQRYEEFVLGCSRCFAQDGVSIGAVSSQSQQWF